MHAGIWLVLGGILLMNAASADTADFDGSISRATLEHYLSRAVTHAGLCNSYGDPVSDTFEDDLRMLRHVGARFIGRAAFAWTVPGDDEAHFRLAAERAAQVHAAAPKMILQACVFETVDRGVERISIPAWVFEEFGLPPEARAFSYDAMLFPDGRFRNLWGQGASVPDMSRLETRLWFFYRARRYLDAGCEAIHFGQVHLMNQNDPGEVHWRDMLERVRRYAKQHARRHLVLCDAHTHGIVHDGRLMFDFHSFPLRIKEVPERPREGILEMGYIDSPYGRSKGGITPSGWACESLPYLAEVDNWGASERPGQPGLGGCWVWGYDEICWFAHQPEDYRNRWLRYAWDWVCAHDPNGWFQMPTRRILAVPVDGIHTYQANTRSAACPTGFGQEETIRAIWAE